MLAKSFGNMVVVSLMFLKSAYLLFPPSNEYYLDPVEHYLLN